MSETNETCVCGGSTARPNADCERCTLLQSLRERDEQLAAVRKERDEIRDKAIEQSECVQRDWASPFEKHGMEGAIARLTARAEAAEREAGRLRLGITAIANQCQSVDTLTPLPGVARQFAADVARACAALLAQPAKEAGDALPEL